MEGGAARGSHRKLGHGRSSLIVEGATFASRPVCVPARSRVHDLPLADPDLALQTARDAAGLDTENKEVCFVAALAPANLTNSGSLLDRYRRPRRAGLN